MQTPGLHQSATRPATPRRARGLVLLGAGTLALVLAATGIAAALTGRFSPATQAHQPSAALVGSNGTSTAAQSSLSVSSVVPVLADGTYPAYIDRIDIRGAKITVDVIQVFENEAAAAAALQDGKSADAEGLWYLYIRNQNTRLRTLPVARDLRIQFADGCEAPGNRRAALSELDKQVKRFDTLYYYDIMVRDGAIHRITQKLAQPAC